MLLLGSVSYAGEEYYMHLCTNGSRVRVVLLGTLTDAQKIRMSESNNPLEIENIKDSALEPMVLQRADVTKFYDYVVGALQTDKKAKKSFFLGNTYLVNRIFHEFESIVNNSYEDGDNGVTLKGTGDDVLVTKEIQGKLYVRFHRIKQYGEIGYIKRGLTFDSNDIHFATLFQDDKPAHAAPYKKWEWTEDLDFSTRAFNRSVISLFAKTLAQLRQEKDLSWYFNKDGTSKKDYKVLHSLDEVREVVNEIEKLRNCILLRNPKMAVPVAIDCETTGLSINSLKKYNEFGEKNPLKDEIGGMTITWKDNQGVYIPFLHTKFENVPREECLTLLKPYLETWYIETHNGLFDGKVFLDNGIKLNIQDDSMIMLFHINPTVAKGSKGLKENTMRRYGDETLDHDDVFPSKKDVTTFYDLTEDIINIYGCADGDYCHKLCRDLRKEIPSMKAYRLDIRVLRYLIKVNYNGNRVDEDLLNKLSSIVDEDIETLEETMFKFVGQIGQLTAFEKVMSGLLRDNKTTKEEVDRLRIELMHDESFKTARYEFSPSKPDELIDILYNKLNYPITRVSKTSGKPTADKFALKDLAKEEVDDSQVGTWLKNDISSASIKFDYSDEYGDKVLIEASKFNKKKYPFVLLVQKWKELIKLKTTFFAWFLNGSCDNMYYSDFSMTNAETSRIIGRIQTLKGAMKKLIVPFSDEYYLMGVDFSQIEARLMAYLAGKWDLVWRLCKPRADYHVESAAMLTGKESWQITKSERGDLKSVNFAVPYGMLEFSLAENLYGRPVTQEKIEKARVLLAKWKKSNWEIQALLDSYRKFAVETRDVPFFNEDSRKVELKKMHFIANKIGRRRYFTGGIYDGLTLDMKTIASIERMAGNYPIQSYAAEIFKTAFVNICRRLEKEGLQDKVFITALVHDEFLMNVHRSVDKYKLFEILWEEMVQSIHLPYRDEDGKWIKNDDGSWKIDTEHDVKYFFAGISIGPEWHDIHSNDAHEVPTEYLMYMVDKIKSGEYQFKDYEKGDVTEECFNEVKEFMEKLFIKECFKLQPDLTPNNVKFYNIVPAFFDYFLKGKLKIYGNGVVRDVSDDSDDIRARLEVLLMKHLNTDKLVCIDSEDAVPRIVGSTESIESTTISASMQGNEVAFNSDESDSLGDFSNLFGDLFDEDLDNFDDDEDSEFGISIPVNMYGKDTAKDYKVLSKRVNPDDKRDIWDLVDFGADIKTYDVNTTPKFMIRSDTIFIDVTDVDIEVVRKLIHYIRTLAVKDGMYSVKLKLSESTKDTGIRVNSISDKEVYKIMGWTLFSTV